MTPLRTSAVLRSVASALGADPLPSRALLSALLSAAVPPGVAEAFSRYLEDADGDNAWASLEDFAAFLDFTGVDPGPLPEDGLPWSFEELAESAPGWDAERGPAPGEWSARPRAASPV